MSGILNNLNNIDELNKIKLINSIYESLKKQDINSTIEEIKKLNEKYNNIINENFINDIKTEYNNFIEFLKNKITEQIRENNNDSERIASIEQEIEEVFKNPEKLIIENIIKQFNVSKDSFRKKYLEIMINLINSENIELSKETLDMFTEYYENDIYEMINIKDILSKILDRVIESTVYKFKDITEKIIFENINENIKFYYLITDIDSYVDKALTTYLENIINNNMVEQIKQKIKNTIMMLVDTFIKFIIFEKNLIIVNLTRLMIDEAPIYDKDTPVNINLAGVENTKENKLTALINSILEDYEYYIGLYATHRSGDTNLVADYIIRNKDKLNKLISDDTSEKSILNINKPELLNVNTNSEIKNVFDNIDNYAELYISEDDKYILSLLNNKDTILVEKFVVDMFATINTIVKQVILDTISGNVFTDKDLLEFNEEDIYKIVYTILNIRFIGVNN